MSTSEQTLQQISDLVKSERVVLFMKGSRNFPQCGFSATVVQLLDELLPEYKTVNVLSDPTIRQGIKDFSEWPTIPQLYVDGEFVGGCDIVKEMFATGDLQKKLGVEVEAVEPPKVTISAAAVAELRAALTDADPDDKIHLAVSPRFEHSLGLGPIEKGAIRAEAGDLEVYVDVSSARRANGIVIDFLEGPSGAGFKIDNPNAPAQVTQVSPKELRAKIDGGEIAEVFDVRPERERAMASIDGAKVLDDEAVAYIESLPRDTPIAFYCHHGRRSQATAEHFRDMGFRKLFNLSGGIDRWSLDVDSSVPRY